MSEATEREAEELDRQMREEEEISFENTDYDNDEQEESNA